MPIGLYVHIPFCLHKCGYCDFNSHAGSDRAEQAHYVDALLREMELWATRPEVAGEQVSTVYVGGGTPTLLEGAELARVLRGVREHFRLAPDAEVTVEGNPGTVDVEGEKLHLAVQAGATRLSLGVQARQRHLLERLGRIHDALQVEAAVKAARRAGFANLNLDLMYGLPGQTPADFRETVSWALGLGPTHISAYSLIIEEGTPFYHAYLAGRLHLPPEEAEEQMFLEGKALLEAAGFEHYEVSNWARPGFRCRHNLIYWRNEHYLGLGCGAHSFLRLAAPLSNLGPPRPGLTASRVQGGSPVETAPGLPGQQYRFWNLKHPGAYRAALERGVLPVEAGEVVDRRAEMAETMFMGLRLLEGVSGERFEARFGVSIADVYGPDVDRLRREGLLEWAEGALRLTPRGLRLGNRVWEAFV
ncbi:radical SAM family heme chaperone HemW [Symbiobacterium thermophilum]|uniref:Heme chaperone HemW n=1 Tax=Symbiobacterium thermophilum (strain DSM 24528 / JCM 14929 / IAM 14863 / T) TaxID=292459 RepID=Q67S75_SYMTH|nr:radical SAM family heme chaperone HemW [Symbiobacterium thermophilum]BAD39468.1 coproporphyrinogen III oxidase [Symbiobacterium thermophilum IAM 14863]